MMFSLKVSQISKKIDRLLFESIGYEHFNPDLKAIQRALEAWSLLELDCKIITIAGTNGKGETTRTLGHLLGKNYAQWTSPHIFNVSERMVFDGKKIDEDKLLRRIEYFLDKHEELETPLSYYEFLFVVFLSLVKESRVQYLLLEVGLGGRLDAVNVLSADIVLLTSIGRDHQEFLGNRLDKILLEKLGVTRPDKILISTLELKYLRQIVDEYRRENHIKWIDLFDEGMQRECMQQSDNFSRRNQLLAIKAYELLTGVVFSAKHDLSQRVEFKWFYDGVSYLGFGTHNPDGLRKLVQFLSQENYNNFDTLVVSFSKRKDEDIKSMFKILTSLRVNYIKVVGFNHPKAMNVQKLKNLALANEKVEFVDDISKLKQKISTTTAIKSVFVCGSYYFLGQLRASYDDLGEK